MNWFKELFKDENNINEKAVIGFASFAMMIIFAAVDIVSEILGHNIDVEEFIYNSFLWITLGCFGISEVGKSFGTSKRKEPVKDEPKKEDNTINNI